MSENDFAIKNPNNFYNHLDKAIRGLEKHEDIEGALANLRWLRGQFDAVKAGAEFEEWLKSLFRFDDVRRIQIENWTVLIETSKGSTIPGDVIETIVNEMPDEVNLEGVLIGDYDEHYPENSTPSSIELKYPVGWHLERERYHFHTDSVQEYRK